MHYPWILMSTWQAATCNMASRRASGWSTLPEILALPNSSYVMNDALHVIYMYMFVCLLFMWFLLFFFYFKDLGVTGEVQTMSEGVRELTLTLRHKRMICSTREIRTRGGEEGGGRCGIKKVIMLIVLSINERWYWFINEWAKSNSKLISQILHLSHCM